MIEVTSDEDFNKEISSANGAYLLLDHLNKWQTLQGMRRRKH